MDGPPPAAPAEGPAAKIDKDGRVFEGGRNLGRITYLWKNPFYPTMTVYCRKHQCNRAITAKRNPYESGAVKWLSWGHTDACADKAAHLAAWEAMVLKP